MKLHFLRLSLPLSLPLSASQLEGSLLQQAEQALGQPVRLLRWSLTAVEADKVWVEGVVTTEAPDPACPKSI